MTTSSTNLTGLYGGGAGGAIPNTAYGNANVVGLLAAGTDGANTVGNITATGVISTSGNVATGSFFIGDGSKISNITAANITGAYSNANVAAFLPVYGGNVDATQVSNTGLVNIASEGTVQLQYDPSGTYDPYTIDSGSWMYIDAGGVTFDSNATGTTHTLTIDNNANLTASGNIAGNYFIGNGSQLTGLPATYSNAQVSAYLASGTNSANIITSANISGSYILGNGSQLTGLPATYSNAQVAAYLASGTNSSNIITSGNVSGAFLLGNGSALTSITGANVTGTVANATHATVADSANTVAGANVTGTVANATHATVADSANTVAGANVTGTVANATYATTAGVASSADAVAGANVTGTVANATYATTAGVASSADAVAGANVTGNVANAVHAYFADVANSVSGSNVSGAVANAVYADNAGLAVYVTGNAQANITSVGTLTGLNVNGAVSASGNVTGGNILTSGTVSAMGNVDVQGTVSATGNIITTGYFVGNFAGNITGNLTVPGSNTQVLFNTNGNADATGGFTYNKDANTMTVLGIVSAQGNVIGGNVTTAGIFAGNAAGLTNIPGANVTGQVANALVAGTVYTNAQPNITSVGILSSLDSSGNISAAGNITGNYLFGNGSQLTGMYGNANVVSMLSANSNVIIGNVNTFPLQANITTVMVGANAAITSGGGANPQYVTLMNNLYYDTTGNTRYRNTTTTGAAQLILGGGNLYYNPTFGSTTANTQVGIGTGFQFTAAGLSTVNGYNMTSAGNMAIGGTGGLTTSQTTGNLFNATATTVNLGGAATAINAGAATVSLTLGSGTGNATLNNLNATGVKATGTFTGAYTDGTVVDYLTGNGRISVGTADGINFYNSGIGNVLLASLAASGTFTPTGNIITPGILTNNYYYANGTPVSFAGTYGNANVSNYLASGTNTANIITTGNVQGTYVIGNGSALTSITGANVTGTVADATHASVADSANAVAGGNVTGNVANAVHAYFADVANSVSGGNVTGQVANALVAGTVYTNAQPNITSVGILTSLSSTGNVDAGNLVTGGGVYATGVVSAAGNVRGGNINTAGLVTATGNITGGNIDTAGLISATGNITGANVIGSYLWGDGSNITGVVTGSETVQIAVKNTSGGTLAKGTPVYATGTVGATDVLEVSASRADTGSTMPAIGLLETTLTNNATGYVISIGHLGSYDTSTYTIGQTLYVAATGGLTNVRPIDGNLVQPIGTVGRVNASTGSVEVNTWNYFQLPNLGSGNIWLGNSSQYPVETTLATYSGNIGAGNLSVTGNTVSGNLLTAGIVSAAGNVTGAYISGNGSLLSSITGANVTGTVADASHATVADSANAVAGGNVSGQVANALVAGTVYTAAQPNITSVGILTSLSATGNITGNYFIGNGSQLTGLPATYSNADVSTYLASGTNTANIITTGNISGSYYLGNGSLLTGITSSAAGSNTQITYNNAGTSAGNAAMTFNNTNGNIGMGNLIIGSVPFGSAGGAQQINTIANNSGTLATATTFGNGQIIIGQGYFGNLALNNLNGQGVKGAKFGVWDSATVTDGGNAGIRYSTLSAASQLIVGNLNNNNTIFRASSQVLSIGGGASANTLSQSSGQGIIGVAAAGGTLFAGQPNATVALGNVTIGGGVGQFGQTICYAGSNIGNAAGVMAQINNITGNIQNGLGYVTQFTGTAGTTPVNIIGLYNPNNTVTFGVSNSNSMRAATNYYFLKNDDAVAQNQLGSLRAYHTFQAGGNTTGTWDIDKTAGQVQAISLTGNVTIGSYTNFVTTANDGTNNDNQTDTVTLIIEQGSTPYTVTMPTGNASIKYANNISTITSTANTTTMIAITAYRTAANATGYLTTISPAFS